MNGSKIMNDSRPGYMVTVKSVVEETSSARSLIFEIPDELVDVFDYEPGQFLTLNIPSRQGPTARCYSLASSPYLDEPLKVTIKRTEGGYASNLLCDYPVIPFLIEVLKPSGKFTPPNLNDDFVLFAGGSGITPIMSIVKSVLHGGSGSCHLFYANRDTESTIFGGELGALREQFTARLCVEHWTEDERGGFASEQDIEKVLADHPAPQVFTCGPAPFMHLVRAVTHRLGLPHDHVHFEEFASLAGDPFAPIERFDTTDERVGATVKVELDGTLHTLSWPPHRTLVDIMINAGIDVPYSCREGECGSCVCTLVEGTVDPGKNDLLDTDDIDDGVILGCQVKPTSATLRIEF
jgi:3-ketosteroid 9alpha-monooxygenase subunit B